MNRSVRLRMILLAVLVGISMAAPWIAPYDPIDIPDAVLLKYQPPSLAHPFGTDAISRDVLSRVLVGSRVSLAIASGSVTVALLVGMLYGAFAAFSGKWMDRICMRVLDVALAMPRLLILLAVTAIWRDLSVPEMVVLLGLTGWFDIARITRAEVSSHLARDFVLAGRALGIQRARLAWRHILPHVIPTLAVSATLGVAYSISLEAGLSYLGLGVQPPAPSWGNIIYDGKGVFPTYWWLTLFPGMAIVLTVLACNALGDALRNQFAPDQVDA